MNWLVLLYEYIGSELNDVEGEDPYNNAQNVVPRPLNAPYPRYLQDREKLYAKIMEDEKQKGILEKPKLIGVNNGVSSSSSTRRMDQVKAPSGHEGVFQNVINSNNNNIDHESWNDLEVVQNTIAGIRPWGKGNTTQGHILIFGGEDPSPDVEEKRDFIKQVIGHFMLLLA